jgi:hypothetical protein
MDLHRDESVLLPPFRSSKEFPISPSQDEASELYPDCYQALIQANDARRILRVRMDKKRQMIAEIRQEIERIELDLAVEAQTRTRLHAMNMMLIEALRDTEKTSDELTRIVAKAQSVPRTGLRDVIKNLKLLVRRWRESKATHFKKMTDGNLGHDGGSDG